MFVGGMGIAFYWGPILALICLAYIPLFIILIVAMGKNVKMAQLAKLNQLEKLGSHTEETLSAIKLVISFAQEDLSNKKYEEICAVTRDIAVKASKLQGTMSGCFLFLMFGFFLYAYSAASYLLQYEYKNPRTGNFYTIMEITVVA